MRTIKIAILASIIWRFLFTPSTILAGTTSEFTIEYGKTETVYSWKNDRCHEEDIPDFPPRALVDSNGNVQLYSSDYLNRKFIGPNLTDVNHDCHVTLPSHNNGDPTANDDYEFLTSPYTLDGKTIYGLVHEEYHGGLHNNCSSSNTTNCRWNAINLVISTDGGNTYTHSSPPSHTIAQTSIAYNPSNTLLHTGFFQPSNIVKKDGYFYSKMTVRIPGYSLINPGNYGVEGICVMRTNNLSDPLSWKLWDGTGWSVSPKGVPNTGVCAKTFMSDWDWHYSTYLATYLSLGAFPGNTTYTGTIQTSKDLVRVDTPYKNIMLNTSRHSMYYTFLQPGAETRNFEDIGRSPWLYYVTCGDDNAPCTSFTNNNRDLRRVRVRFSKPNEATTYDVLDLRFNEYKGPKSLDSSFYGNDALLSGNYSLMQNENEKYIHFGNNPGIASIANSASLQLSSDISVSLRVRTSQIPNSGIYPPLVVKAEESSRSYGLFLTPNGKVLFSLGNGSNLSSIESTSSINDGLWHTILVRYSDASSIATISLDGVVNTSSTLTQKLQANVNQGPLIIGGNSYVGDIDQLTLYNYIVDPPTERLGDFNADGKVNTADFSILRTEFGTKYTIFDYNNLVANYGK